jgi:hypothetical protein
MMTRRAERELLDVNFSYVDNDDDALRPTYFGPTSLHAPVATKETKKNTREGKDIRRMREERTYLDHINPARVGGSGFGRALLGGGFGGGGLLSGGRHRYEYCRR